MKQNTCCTVLVMGLLVFITGSAVAASSSTRASYAKNNYQFWMQGGLEAWGGDVTYRIGYPVTDASGMKYYGYFPFSELEFPLDASFGVIKGGAVLGEKFVINGQFKTNVSEPDDHMIDRDWITASYQWRLDIYSESEVTDFSALILDGDVSYKVLDWDILWLSVGAGYMYQNFEYETAVLHQWSPSGLSGYDYWGDGTTSLIYEADVMMPYLLMIGKFDVVDNLKINARFALAPWVVVEDEDQHLLRDKVNVGDLEGSAVMLSVDTQYDFTPHFFVNGGLSFTYIEADGDMDAAFGGVYDHTVEEEWESKQTSLVLTIGYRF